VSRTDSHHFTFRLLLVSPSLLEFAKSGSKSLVSGACHVKSG